MSMQNSANFGYIAKPSLKLLLSLGINISELCARICTAAYSKDFDEAEVPEVIRNPPLSLIIKGLSATSDNEFINTLCEWIWKVDLEDSIHDNVRLLHFSDDMWLQPEALDGQEYAFFFYEEDLYEKKTTPLMDLITNQCGTEYIHFNVWSH